MTPRSRRLTSSTRGPHGPERAHPTLDDLDVNGGRDLRILVELADDSQLSSIRQTVLHIVAVVDDPRSSARDLTNIIITDPTLSARLLRLANSAYYGLPRGVSSIHEAIICIGFEAVKELALTQKVCEIFAQDDEGFGYSRFALWRHSVAVALCARQLCRRMAAGPRPETAYAAGLLHDIGTLVIDQFLQFDFLVILRDAVEENNNQVNVEEMVLGFNHADVGMGLTRYWQFPEVLASAIGHHHSPTDAPELHGSLGAVLFVADDLIHGLRIGFSDTRHRDRLQFARCLRALRLTEDVLSSVVAEVQADLSRIQRLGWYRGLSRP